MDINTVCGHVVDCSLKVHSALGPGPLESAHEACLSYDLRERGLTISIQHALPVIYKEVRFDLAYRIDPLVNEAVIVELKVVEKLTPLHEAQLLSYLRLSGKKVGLLINFQSVHLKDDGYSGRTDNDLRLARLERHDLLAAPGPADPQR